MKVKKLIKDNNKSKLIFYYSGEGDRTSDPEVFLKHLSNIMLTFWKSRERLQIRFKALWKARKRKLK